MKLRLVKQETGLASSKAPPLKDSIGIYTGITSPSHLRNNSTKLLASNSQSSPHTAQFKHRSTLFYAEQRRKSDSDDNEVNGDMGNHQMPTNDH